MGDCHPVHVLVLDPRYLTMPASLMSLLGATTSRSGHGIRGTYIRLLVHNNNCDSSVSARRHRDKNNHGHSTGSCEKNAEGYREASIHPKISPNVQCNKELSSLLEFAAKRKSTHAAKSTRVAKQNASRDKHLREVRLFHGKPDLLDNTTMRTEVQAVEMTSLTLNFGTEALYMSS